MRLFDKRLVLTAFAVFAYIAVAQSAGYWVTAGISVALALVVWSLFSKRRRAFIFIRLAVVSFGLTAIWFLAVDWSWFVEDCPDCLIRRDIAQYRVLGYSVYEKIDATSTILERALTDLGTPCLHDNLEHWHKHRWWGLLVCGVPCWNGIDGLSAADDRYTPELSARVRTRGLQDPKLAAELHHRVVELHDYIYFWEAFMVDEMAPQWVEATSTHEALTWLKHSSAPNERLVNNLKSTEASIDLIKSAYDAGASEVLAIEIEGSGDSTKHEAGALLIKLPNDSRSRRSVLVWVDEHDETPETPRIDYGQTYVRFCP
jgi:hypothetical protein